MFKRRKKKKQGLKTKDKSNHAALRKGGTSQIIVKEEELKHNASYGSRRINNNYIYSSEDEPANGSIRWLSSKDLIEDKYTDNESEEQNNVQTEAVRKLLRRSSIGIVDTNIGADDNDDGSFFDEYNTVLQTMKDKWGVSTTCSFTLEMQVPMSRSTLESAQDAIIVTESWNKALAFRSMFSEALVGRWRMVTAISSIVDGDNVQENQPPSPMPQSVKNRRSSLIFRRMSSTVLAPHSRQALYLVEKNIDPLACYLGVNIRNIEALVIGFIDMAVRELCPHNQIVQREAYRALKGSSDPDKDISNPFLHEKECRSLDDYCMQFARYGIKPKHWLDFCEAFIWTMKTHNPYAHQEQDIDDFEKPTNESAHTMFVAGMIALPMIEASLRDRNYLNQRIFSQLQDTYESFQDELSVEMFREGFHDLFQKRPELADNFAGKDGVDHLLLELLAMMEHILRNLHDIRTHDSDIRNFLVKQGELWLEKQVPFDFTALLGNLYLDIVHPYLYQKTDTSLAMKLEVALAYLYKEAMYFIMHPLVVDKNLRDAVSEFYNEVASELEWSKGILRKRMVEINLEIIATGTYTQTSQEIEIGARLAWRNSAKCIGRIAWNTLKVRDCRHIFSADAVFNEIEEHIRIASGGTNIESVMTVFRPQQPNEAWGMRFWSSQFFRYAGYKDEGTDKVLGDPANAEFTDYLIRSRLWTPPATRTAFDLLPLVLKMPSIDKPFVYTIPQDLRHELDLEHPQFRDVKKLGLKWAAIPAISNFKMTLGGLNYPCMPFNGWFLSTEIARNLLERYQMTLPLAKAMKIPPNDRMLYQKVAAEVENAILHSFEKHEYTIVDPMTVGKSFMTHCKRERESGRECPGQWSWIGGLVGPTNPTWHLEMRDFKKNPQYEYASDPWQVITVDDNLDLDDVLDTTQHIAVKSLTKGDKSKVRIKLPRVLIAFGSETGNAEAAANSLARKLKMCKPKIMSLNNVMRKVEMISQEYTHFLTICSTFGSGEPPSNAKSFFDTELNSLDRVLCATLAIGSSLYPKFCQAGKNLNVMIRDAEGDSLMKLTCVDTSIDDSQNLITLWLERISKLVLPDSLVADIAAMGPVGETSSTDTTYQLKWKQKHDKLSTELKLLSFPRRLTMRCAKNYELFSKGNISTRSTRQIEFDLPEGVTYETGDHLSINPINDLLMVQRFLNCFSYEIEKAAKKNGFSPQESFSKVDKIGSGNLCSPSIIWQVQQPFDITLEEDGQTISADIHHLANRTLLEVLQMHLDLSLDQESYAEDLLSMMKERLKKSPISSSLSNDFYKLFDSKRKSITNIYPTIVHLLEALGSIFCKPRSDSNTTTIISLADVLVLMPRLNPRYYSISSSAEASPTRVSITVGVVNSETATAQKQKGVCSHYLANLQPDDRAKVTVKTSTFRTPKNKAAPIIMVGSGTGLAPFMGFLRKRSKDWYTGSNKKVGECHLFFGCRSRNEILYRDELASWQSAKFITLHLAVSRDKRLLKQYVHDQLKLNGRKVNSLLQNDETHFYICGDARMAADCTKMCIDILTTAGRMSRVAAIQHINQMRVEDRWQYDLYGASDSLDALEEKEHPKEMTASAGNIWAQRFLHTVTF